jgi:hypothetical protein
MRYFLLLVTLIIAVPVFSQQAPPNVNIFRPLDEEIAEKGGMGLSNSDKARIFEKIYLENSANPGFEGLLFTYLNSDDRYYWIGMFLDEPYYTKINNFGLSMKVLKAGLDFVKQDEQKVRYLWVIGKKLYYKNRKAESLEYLVPAFRLSDKYPGNTPAWESEKEADEFEAFIKSNMKKDN